MTFASKYQDGAACRSIDSRRPAKPVWPRVNNSTGSAEPSPNITLSSAPNSKSGIATSAKNGSDPPEPTSNMTAPAKTHALAVTISKSREARCADNPLSNSTPANPATDPTSTGSVAYFPANSSTTSQGPMIAQPHNASRFVNLIRLDSSTDSAEATPV